MGFVRNGVPLPLPPRVHSAHKLARTAYRHVQPRAQSNVKRDRDDDDDDDDVDIIPLVMLDARGNMRWRCGAVRRGGEGGVDVLCCHCECVCDLYTTFSLCVRTTVSSPHAHSAHSSTPPTRGSVTRAMPSPPLTSAERREK
jgi:hypothetical protein